MPPEALAPRFGLDCAVQQQINQTFALFPQIERVTLYGSRAKGNYRPGSDIDLAISAPGMTQDQLCDLENRLDDLLLPYKIDLCLIDQIDNPDLLAHIARVGQVFYPAAA
jgi:predicted nucleotidyltransferase